MLLWNTTWSLDRITRHRSISYLHSIQPLCKLPFVPRFIQTTPLLSHPIFLRILYQNGGFLKVKSAPLFCERVYWHYISYFTIRCFFTMSPPRHSQVSSLSNEGRQVTGHKTSPVTPNVLFSLSWTTLTHMFEWLLFRFVCQRPILGFLRVQFRFYSSCESRYDKSFLFKYSRSHKPFRRCLRES